MIGLVSNYCNWGSKVDHDYYPDFNLNLLGDLPNQVNLSEKTEICGYIDIKGKIYSCKSCEHETIVRKIVWDNEDIRGEYFTKSSSFYDNMPRGMLQEEYFLMKELGFIKISSFSNTPNQKVLFYYNNLSEKQAEIIYPR